MGTTTTAEPAASPETTLPNARAPMLGAALSKMGPMMEKMAVRRMVNRRPYLLHNGPEARAPRRPPRVYMEETTENWAVSIEIH